jgi:hypothetical protein
MEPHRMRAPREDGVILAEPPLEQAGEILAANLTHMRAWDHDFQGRRAGRLRAMARSQLLSKAREYLARFDLPVDLEANADGPWIVTGHQPELFHPGVWIKNFATAAIARKHGGIGLNLIVDNDLPKSASIRVPGYEDQRLIARSVEFDRVSGEAPFEDCRIEAEELFASFADRVRNVLGGLVADPIISNLWPRTLQAAEVTDRAGLRISAARRSLEASWGVKNFEVPLGLVCETEAFGWFACHLLAHLPRFQATHNAALGRYRALYKIRSKNHPVPLLDREGDWIEAPFWVWRDRSPRRRPLMARQNPKSLDLRIAGETEILGSLRLSPERDACCAIEDLQDLARRGIRIRTRALTTTMFARLLLGDLFVHGIGGAKYDELGDEVIRGFFGIAPPRFLTLSMTRWLGLPFEEKARAELDRLDRFARDLRYNPDHVLAENPDPTIQSLISAKKKTVAGPISTRRERAARFREIRRLNGLLSEFLSKESERVSAQREQLLLRKRDNSLATGRDWSFALHSETRWRGSMEFLLPEAFTSKKMVASRE